MHEAALVAGIVRIAEEEAKKYGAVRITGIRLQLGLLACVEEQTLQGCFELWTEQGCAQGAVLTIQRLPLACHCTQCGHDFTLQIRHFACPHCDARHIDFTGGHECTIHGIDADREENAHE